MNHLPNPEYAELDPQTSSSTSETIAPSFERDPIQLLKGSQAEVYCQLLEGLIKGGRPNSFFPSGRGMENLVYLLRPSTNRGLSDEIQVNLRTGLPNEPNIGRVIADKDVCGKILRSHDVDSVHQREDEASKRLVQRIE